MLKEVHGTQPYKNTNSKVVSQSRTYAPGYGDLTFGAAELGEVKSLHILGVTLDSKLTLETHLRVEASQKSGCREPSRKLSDCPRVLRSIFNAYVLSILEHRASVYMSSAESHLSLLDCIFRSAEEFCEGELCWLGPLSALDLLYETFTECTTL